MKLNITTNYAVRYVVYMAEKNGVTPASELGEVMGVSKEFAAITVGKLRKAGIVKGVRGVNGGFQLAKSPSEISLYDIVTVMEGDIKINRVTDEESDKTTSTGLKNIRLFYEEMQTNMEDVFKEKKIASFLK